jgi:hydroxymethylbilane synthase
LSERLRIGTRRSALALWQAEHVAALLRGAKPDLEIELVRMTTQGDRFLHEPLAAMGGKGLFVREIEEALLRGEVDLAVHSLKDLPAGTPAGLRLARPLKREDPRDALVAREGQRLDDLPRGARVGTSSLRRNVQLRAIRPDLRMVPIRGNVQTRLGKTLGPAASGEELLDAVVLALAGLKRLGLEGSVTEALEPARCLPAVGQGILAIQHRDGDDRARALLEPFGDPATEVAARAERALLEALGAGCDVPLGGYATLGEAGDRLTLTAVLGDPQTAKLHRVQRQGPPASAEQLGREAARELLAGEGGRLLKGS